MKLYLYVCVCEYMYVYICVYACVYACVCMHVCMYMYMCVWERNRDRERIFDWKYLTSTSHHHILQSHSLSLSFHTTM